MKYFAYGSNLLRQRLLARTPSARVLTTARLVGHELCFHKAGSDGSGKADARSTEQFSHEVWGVVYELSQQEKRVLDEIEGLGRGYRQKTLVLETHSGPLTAFAYLAMPAFHDGAMVPFHWYKRFVLAGAIQHGFPESYIEGIRKIASRLDPDEVRARLQHEILLRAGPPDLSF